MRTYLLIAAALLCACSKKKHAPDKFADETSLPTSNTETSMKPPESSMPSTSVDLSKPTDIARATNHFAFELWKRAGAGNLALSPASIATALTITSGGAKGTTATQMQKVLGVGGAPDVVLPTWGSLYKSLSSPTLKMANRIYGERSFSLDAAYVTSVQKSFDVSVEPLDFASDAESSRSTINTWVASATEQRIKDLLPPRSIDAETKLVIVNAIYFLADWAHPFNASLTQPREFFVGGMTPKPVPTMSQTRAFNYAHDGGASLVELPYKGQTTSMYILVPDARDGLPALEAKLAGTFDALRTKLGEQPIALSLPRFTIDPPSSVDLAKVLQELGIVDAFSPDKADFSNLATPKTPADKIFISAVFHKAFVKVDEKGTEAAAATAVAMPRGGRPATPTELRVDHPFLFVIADKPSGLILFIGRVLDPR